MVLVGLESDRATGPDHLASRIRELDRTVADERDPRLPVANLGLETLDLGLRDVRRIRDDEVERAGEPGDEVGLDERDRETEPFRVLPGERERVPRDVGGGDDRTGMLIGDREGDRTRSRADVDHRRGVDSSDRGQRPLDERLGLRPRHERASVGPEHEAPEAPLAQDVGERLAAAAPLDERSRRCSLGLVQRLVEARVELEAGQAERVGKDQLGVEPRSADSLSREVLGRRREHLAEGHFSPPSSARRCASAASASVKTKRSPVSTSCRRPFTPTR